MPKTMSATFRKCCVDLVFQGSRSAAWLLGLSSSFTAFADTFVGIRTSDEAHDGELPDGAGIDDARDGASGDGLPAAANGTAPPGPRSAPAREERE